MFDSFFNAIFGRIIEASPLGAILLIALIITVVTTLVYKWVTNQKLLKQMKEDMDAIRKQMKDSKNDTQKMMALQKESLQKSLEQMKHTIKPMLITFIPLIIIFGWLQNTYTDKGNLIGPLNWLWVYIISTFIYNLSLRKLLKVH